MKKPNDEQTRLNERWIRTESDRVAIAQGCWFDQEAADELCWFFENVLKQTVGRYAGKPFILAPWQRDFLSRLYGWKRADGLRRFKEAYIEIPKKNGKSTLFAGLCLYGLFEEATAEVYCGATNRPQAKTVFKECARMVAYSPSLKKRLKVLKSTTKITYDKTFSQLEALSADAEGRDGANATMIGLDELHRFKTRTMYDVWAYAGEARDEALFFNITTAGTNRASICWEVHERARKILDGSVTEDIEFLPIIFAAKETDNLDDPETWKRANPALGTILKMQDFQKKHALAKRIPAQWANFCRLRLNIWTSAEVAWLDVAMWNACGEWFTEDKFVGKETFATVDMSSVDDLTAITLTCDEGDYTRSKTFLYAPLDVIVKKAEKGDTQYLRWYEAGYLTACQGASIKFGDIRQKLNDLRDKGIDIILVAFDPHQAVLLSQELAEDGFETRMVAQNARQYSGPCKALERHLLDKTILHDGNPATAWCVANAVVKIDDKGNMMPYKPNPGQKIDGLITTLMGIGVMRSYVPPPTPKVTLYR